VQCIYLTATARLATRVHDATLVAALSAALACSASRAQDSPGCSTGATACAAGCAVRGGLGALLGQGKYAAECKARCEADLRACVQRSSSVPVKADAPAALGGLTEPQRANGDAAETSPASAGAVAPQRLGVGELSLVPLVPKTKHVREVLSPALDGIPAYLAAPASRTVSHFRRSYRESVLGLRRPDAGSGINNDGEGFALHHYFRVRQALGRGVVGLAPGAQPESFIVLALDPTFNRLYFACTDAVSGARTHLGACGGGGKTWKGETEFEAERTKNAFAAEAKTALFSAYGQTTFRFVLLEQRQLGNYESQAGGFAFNTSFNGSVLTVQPARSGDDGVAMTMMGIALKFPKAPPDILRMPPEKAESWTKTLLDQNRRDGIDKRTVFTLTRVTCRMGEPGSAPNTIPCSLDGFDVYNDADFTARAPL
jgi:hypothetical protein